MEPTKQLIEKVNQAFLDNNMDVFMDMIADDMVWEMHSSSTGHNVMSGKAEIGNMDAGNMPEKMDFTFDTTVIEGNIATVSGSSTGTTKDGSDYKGYFCDIYHFRNGKIQKMVSYVIDNMKST